MRFRGRGVPLEARVRRCLEGRDPSRVVSSPSPSLKEETFRFFIPLSALLLATSGVYSSLEGKAIEDSIKIVLVDAVVFVDCIMVVWFLCESTPEGIDRTVVESVAEAENEEPVDVWMSRVSVAAGRAGGEMNLLLEEEMSGGRREIREEVGEIEFDLSSITG